MRRKELKNQLKCVTGIVFLLVLLFAHPLTTFAVETSTNGDTRVSYQGQREIPSPDYPSEPDDYHHITVPSRSTDSLPNTGYINERSMYLVGLVVLIIFTIILLLKKIINYEEGS